MGLLNVLFIKLAPYPLLLLKVRYLLQYFLSIILGKINWALAEELEPCRETSLVGCSNRRMEAWSDESYSPI